MSESDNHTNESERLEKFIAAPKRAVWTMAIPMMAGTAVHTLYIIVDTAFIGWLGTEALAAATLVGPLFFVMFTLTMGLGTAVTALVAQAVGRKDSGGADHMASNAMTIGLILGIALATLGLFFGQSILALLGASGATAQYGWQYFQIIAMCVPLFFISTVLRSVLTGEGDAKTPMLVMGGSTVVNIAMDGLLIFGLGLGIRGAALATATAQIFSLAIYLVLFIRRKKAFVRFSLSKMNPSGEVSKQIAALGIPSAAGMMVMAIGAMALNRVLVSFGEQTIAAYGAASKVDMIVGMPIFGLASAAVAIIGMFAGAGKVKLVRSTALYTYQWALTLALGIGIVAYLCSDWIMMIFVHTETELAIGQTYLGYMIFSYPLMAIGMTSGRLLQGLGYGYPSLIITLIRVFLIAVPASYIAVYFFEMPVHTIWLSILAGGLCATVVALFWVRKVIWLDDPSKRARQNVQTDSEQSSTLPPPRQAERTTT